MLAFERSHQTMEKGACTEKGLSASPAGDMVPVNTKEEVSGL